MLVLFGQPENWHEQDFRAVDDRVRGGSSISHLTEEKDSDGKSRAKFWGTLDTKTLGGAGFCSQATNIKDRTWNLKEFKGIELDIAKSDSYKYTFIIKDCHQDWETSDEKSSLSYEYDFTPIYSKEDQVVSIPFSEFKPTYRGRPVEGAPELDVSKITQFSIMIRSFFNSQSGDYELVLNSIRAIPKNVPFTTHKMSNEKQRLFDDYEKEIAGGSWCICQ
ncbi:CIA30 family protein [Schizosaccharomyces pombe]|uniref:Uncharacterized protein C9E9.15 n=1 Tax=Schizosaccharomyces pombe (strain 972 / ATCC 24843) TaxID=284812 RepID=YF1F_SCHPO|nr:putative protein CIA30 [Schizosaccharomyces pombe]O14297.2 RecName: Full=Uncharacterized protein C9E9.15 [Schizosaccharomyces pombe 972h-]CAB16413.1 CIA30 protein (predicted) [Schizosaccharomyces pombe]|eukprot:NP_594588.1 putative protein CIA30 [Schizosaccharomyces pombe]